MNHKRNGRRFGWTLAELMVAMMALAILAGLTVKIINIDKAGKKASPFVYAGMENLRQGNVRLMGDLLISSLPANAPEPVPSGPKPKDPYCLGIANLFSTISEINCNTTACSGGADSVCYADDDKFNFQVRNQITYFGLNSKWRTGATAGIDGPSPGTSLEYKPVTICINGAKNLTNEIEGKDCFKLYAFKDGSVIPTGNCKNRQNEFEPCAESNYPFAYEVWEVHKTDPANPEDIGKCTQGDPTCRISTRILPKPEDRSPGISYASAYCVAEKKNPENAERTISSGYCDTNHGDAIDATEVTRTYTDPATGNPTTVTLDLCEGVSIQRCVIKIIKPSMTGFKWAQSM